MSSGRKCRSRATFGATLAVFATPLILPMSSKAADASALCAAVRAATVEIRGEFGPYSGDPSPDLRAGSGFFIAADRVVTAHHVVARLTSAEVCFAGGCRDVVAVVGWPARDLAVLRLGPGPTPAKLGVAVPVGAGQEIVAAGFPGDLGFMCGPGHLTGETSSDYADYLLFDGKMAAEGSSGGPVIAFGKNPKKLLAVGAISGSVAVGSTSFLRAARLSGQVEPGFTEAGVDPRIWREDQPWAEQRDVELKLSAGRPLWEDLQIPAWQDVELAGPADGLCYGFYHPTGGLDIDPEPLATSCDGEAVRYTTSKAETVRIGLWSDAATGFAGNVTLRRR